MIKIYNSRLAGIVILIFFIFVSGCSSDSNDMDPTLTSDVSMSLVVDNSEPAIDDPININLSVSNAGPNTATGIEVSIPLPSGYTYIGDDAESSTSYSESTGTWTIPSLDNGSSADLAIEATVNQSGEYLIVAEVIASDNEDPDSTPNNNVSAEDDQESISVPPVIPSDVVVTTYAVVKGADGLVMDASGNLFAANYGLSSVYKIDKEKVVSTYLTNQPGAAGMAVDDQGGLYLATYNNNQIVKVSTDGSTVDVFASAVLAPIALDFDSEGNLYTNNNVNSAVTKIDADGNKTAISVDIFNNSSLTLDEEGNIYVSDYNSGKITKIDAKTNELSEFTNLSLNSGGIGFIIYSDGNFYATAIADNVIFMIDSDGNAKTIAGKAGVSGTTDGDGNQARFDRPIGIIASEDGNTLYVAQQGGSGAIRMLTGFR
ncbi:MAG: hypothetical protein ABJF11_12365 [Reichenbachiella sp.]|uniref:hypothetical protein n=1 Tax=Reichenbachiella sp. TaxID=2184521 RepID=UPI0032635468